MAVLVPRNCKFPRTISVVWLFDAQCEWPGSLELKYEETSLLNYFGGLEFGILGDCRDCSGGPFNVHGEKPRFRLA